MRLAAKVVVILVLGFIVLLLVDGYLVYRDGYDDLCDSMYRGANNIVESIDDVWTRQGRQAAQTVMSVINRHDAVEIIYLDLESPTDDPSCLPGVRETVQQHVMSDRLRSGYLEHEDADGAMHLVTFYVVDHVPLRTEAIVTDQLLVHDQAALRDFIVRTIAKTSVTFLLGGALVIVLGHEMVRKPLQQLIEKTRRIGKGDLSEPLHMRRWDEFGELAGALNSMCGQLSQTQEQLKQETEARIATTEQLRHAERLHTVGRLASGIAHELGTPLNVISGRAALIASGRLSSHDTVEAAGIIKAEADRITKIIRQLLDFARRNTPRKARIELRDVANQLVEMLDPLAERRNYTLSVAETDTRTTVMADMGQIQQVLTNLVMNAAQSMPEGGKIEVGFRRERVKPPEGQEAKAGDYVCCFVRDEGEGISEDNLQQIFEPFFTTKETGKGTGLGLSISYGIVREHGGWIGVQSEPGKGSCFSVYLPSEDDDQQGDEV